MGLAGEQLAVKGRGLGGWPWLAAIIVIFAFGLVTMVPTSVNPDSAWWLYMSQQMLAGAVPYVDLIEVNPPLMAYLGMPAIGLAELFGLSIGTAFKLYVCGLAAISLWLSWKIIKPHKLPHHIPHRGLILAALAYVLTVLPGYHFGQREHFMLILALPYLFTATLRVRGLKSARWQLIVAAVLAAIGFCIKPHFVLIPAVLELYLLFKLRAATFRRPEPYIMVACGLTYLALIFVITPAYLSEVIGYAAEVYNIGFGSTTAATLIWFVPLIYGVLLGGIYMLLAKIRPSAFQTEYVVFGLAALAALAGYLIQFKGWANHFYPVAALGSVILIGAIARIISSRIVGTVFGLLLLVPLYMMAVHPVVQGVPASYEIRDKQQIKALIAEYEDTDTVFIMTSDLVKNFPLINETGLGWGSRFPALWMMPGVQVRKNTGASSALVEEIGTYVKTAVAEDMARTRPQLVLVDRQVRYFRSDIPYDFLGDFMTNPDFARAWENYRFDRQVGHMAVYQRIDKP
jgi:hypothetical protein